MFSVPFVDLRPSHTQMEGELTDAFERTLRSSTFILGAAVDAFEHEYANFCNSQHCITVGNGLDALKIILLACGIGKGDEVIVPAHTFIATWLAVVAVGATPVGIDVSLETFNLDPALLNAAMTARTRAIIPVHLYGRMANMGEICRIAASHGALVIEDAAQAHGATLQDGKRRTHGIAAAYSFYPTKNLGALGDGGAIVTDDAQLARKARSIRNYGSTKKYCHETIGLNSRLDEVQAAFLSTKLRYLDQQTTARRNAARNYITNLNDISAIEHAPLSSVDESVWHLFVVKTRDRDSLMEHMTQRGIATLVHYPVPSHLQPALAHLGYRRGAFPVTEALSDQVLSLPFWPEIASRDIELVCSTLRTWSNSVESLK